MDFKTLNLLFRCNKEFSHDKIRMQDLSDTECMICTFIFSNANCSQDDVVTALKMDKTTIGKAIANLERKQYVVRTKDEKDKRINRLCITESGYDKISSIMNIHNEWLSEILKTLSPNEQEQFEKYCKRLLEAAEQLSEKQKNGERIDA